MRQQRSRWPAAGLLAIACAAAVVFAGSPEKTDEMDAVLSRVEAALGDEWTLRSKTEIVPITLTGGDGDTLVYYICRTTYENDAPPAPAGLDPVLHNIVDPETAEERRACRVGDLEAVLYRAGDRSYLCWTVSAEYSLAIEYSPDRVPEAEIFRMAESVPANAGT